MTKSDIKINKIFQAPVDRKELEGRLPSLVTEILRQVRSPADPEEVLGELDRDEGFANLYRGWDRMDQINQARAWQMILDRIRQAAIDSRLFCVRCGDCCRGGSPALYDQDRLSLRSGAIRRQDLVTLREGEIAFSSREQKLAIVKQERIKVKEVPGSRTCIFLGPGGDACLIYPDRPWQCQVMECWDPSRFETLLTMPPLTREALLGSDTPLTPLIKTHDERTGLAGFRAVLSKVDAADPATQEKALEMIFYDLHLREFVSEKFGLPLEEMEFFFGRPLVVLCGEYGFRLEKDAKGNMRLIRGDFNTEA